MKRHGLRAFFVLLLLTVSAGVALPAQARSPNQRAALPGSKPSWAQPNAKAADQPLGAKLQFRVYLHGPDDAAAEAAAIDRSTPGSHDFRQWLTPQQTTALFSPSPQTVNTVSKWLRSSGFHVDGVADNRLYVEATGTVDQVQQAFAVQLGSYRVEGQTLRAPDRDLSVPASVQGSILGVIGIDQSQALLRPDIVTPPQDGAGGSPSLSPQLTTPSTVAPPAGFVNAPPCSQYWGEKVDTKDPAYNGSKLPYAPCGYAPDQLRSVYGVNDTLGIEGQGTTVAIIDAFASPHLYQDAKTYAERHDPTHPLKQSQFSEVLFPTNHQLEPPNQCDAAGWYGEQSLDVEAVHAMAPAAKIVYVGGSDCQDISLDKALNKVVAKRLAQIVSNSYGDLGEGVPTAEVQVFHQIAIRAVLEGIGLYFSSGDSGDEVVNLGQPSPDFSASDPFVTAVGGTSLGIDINGNRAVETGWETAKSTLTNGAWEPPSPGAFLYGAGGGTSRLFAEPWYQHGVVPDALARENQTGHHRGRVVPDVAAVGDPNTGMLIGITQTFPNGVRYGEYRVGGTSLSAPVFAGIMALSDSAAGYAHGFINPSLYLREAGTRALHDVKPATGGVVRVDYVNGVNAADGTVTSVRTFDFKGETIHTTKGYDNVTGLGAPNGLWFLLTI